jgi:hypothetical protein
VSLTTVARKLSLRPTSDFWLQDGRSILNMSERFKVENYYDSWIEAFQIFSRYESEGEVAVETDCVLAGPDPDLLTPDDRQKLENHGWIASEAYRCFIRLT